MTDDIADFVRAAIASYLKMPVSEVTATRTFDELGLDSLGALELMLTCEERYGFGLSLDTGTNIVTVGDAIEDITRRVILSTEADDGLAS
jgi:acyl carrier protein